MNIGSEHSQKPMDVPYQDCGISGDFGLEAA